MIKPRAADIPRCARTLSLGQPTHLTQAACRTVWAVDQRLKVSEMLWFRPFGTHLPRCLSPEDSPFGDCGSSFSDSTRDPCVVQQSSESLLPDQLRSCGAPALQSAPTGEVYGKAPQNDIRAALCSATNITSARSAAKRHSAFDRGLHGAVPAARPPAHPTPHTAHMNTVPRTEHTHSRVQ